MGTIQNRSEKKPAKRKRPKVFKLPLPPVNPETIFTYGTWHHIFNFMYDYLESHKSHDRDREDNSTLEITIKDLYFQKVYTRDFNFDRAEKLLSKTGKTQFYIEEHKDRNDERYLSLNIGDEKKDEFWLYEYHNAICFAANGAVGSDGVFIKRGEFWKKPLIWRVNCVEFLEFVDKVEKTLSGQGDPIECRVFMEVRTPHAVITIKCFYEQILLESWKKFFGKKEIAYSRKREHIKPEFILTIIN